jgi:hypothetical protein
MPRVRKPPHTPPVIVPRDLDLRAENDRSIHQVCANDSPHVTTAVAAAAAISLAFALLLSFAPSLLASPVPSTARLSPAPADSPSCCRPSCCFMMVEGLLAGLVWSEFSLSRQGHWPPGRPRRMTFESQWRESVGNPRSPTRRIGPTKQRSKSTNPLCLHPALFALLVVVDDRARLFTRLSVDIHTSNNKQ